MKYLYLLLLAIISFGSISAQKKIVVLGSSTAAGGGASTFDSSWVGRLQSYFRKNITAGDPDTIVTNLAQAGFYTFNVMPAWYTPPSPSYPQVMIYYNISRAIFLNPDVIIVNLPSNDAVWPFPNWQTMNNFRTIFHEAAISNKRIFVTTSQPINNPNLNIRDSLRKIKDSILLNFGQFAIDFWTPLASPAGDSSIRSNLNADGTHVNNAGHRALFEQVIAKDLFPALGPLPLKLLSFDANTGSNGIITLQWTTTEEESSTKFEVQRSANGRDFSSEATVNRNGVNGTSSYSWTDHHPLDGKNYYRLKITEPSKTSYSKIVVTSITEFPIAIGLVYFSDPDVLRIKITGKQYETLEVSLVSMSGVVVKKQQTSVTGGGEIVMPVNDLAPGKYIIYIGDTKGNVAIKRFTRFK